MPPGHTYIVKQLTAFSNPVFGPFFCDFRSVTTGETRWSAGGPDGSRSWFGFYGALVFGEGEEFQFETGATLTDGVDVYAGGYDLTN